MKKNFALIAAIVSGFLLVGTATVRAVPTLTIFDGTTTITVLDNLAGDDKPLESGRVVWSGTIGVWTVNLDAGLTKPVIGSATSPQMDLQFSARSTAPSGVITLTFSDDGFTYNGGLNDQWGGTAAGTVTNRVLVNGVTQITQGPLGPGSFSSEKVGLFNLAPSDLLALSVTINHPNAGLTTGDKFLIPVPEGGATVGLLGLSLLGLVAFRRKL